jgi:hypothetical protein
LVWRTPTIYQIDIAATSESLAGDTYNPMSALETLRKLVSGAKVAIQDAGREETTFTGDVIAVQEEMVNPGDDQEGYLIHVFVRRWDVT